ncbi:MAG: hypothetical protein MUF49_02575 [Oculatellaceae cyanobacterium Prado106]|jgi:hypothetical protein|nr:hypothetical protein [Oculatellaceae cyanobacterium Prado106]
MKTNFLCLLGLVTFVVSYAPVAQADTPTDTPTNAQTNAQPDESLQFDESSFSTVPWDTASAANLQSSESARTTQKNSSGTLKVPELETVIATASVTPPATTAIATSPFPVINPSGTISGTRLASASDRPPAQPREAAAPTRLDPPIASPVSTSAASLSETGIETIPVTVIPQPGMATSPTPAKPSIPTAQEVPPPPPAAESSSPENYNSSIGAAIPSASGIEQSKTESSSTGSSNPLDSLSFQTADTLQFSPATGQALPQPSNASENGSASISVNESANGLLNGTSSATVNDSAIAPAPDQPATKPARPLELGFDLPPAQPPTTPAQSAPVQSAAAPAAPKATSATIPPLVIATGETIAHIFEGSANSLVARAVGSAEGTRTPDGNLTPAYYGHVDPGNRVWNLGSFSYQHQAKSPEDADQRQLSRLQLQAKILEQKAAAKGLKLSLEEKLNGIDLANQAPKAALDRQGYVDWLVTARQKGMKGSEAVLWARTRSFINPVTQRWDAPGLGNTAENIGRDQARRMDMIARAIAFNHQAAQSTQVAQNPNAQPTRNPSPQQSQVTQPSASQEPEYRGLARILAEQVMDLFSSNAVPEASRPVASEPSGIQQLFNF